MQLHVCMASGRIEMAIGQAAYSAASYMYGPSYADVQFASHMYTMHPHMQLLRICVIGFPTRTLAVSFKHFSS